MAGSLQAALDDCNHALALHAGDPSALDSRGLVYLRMKNPAAALADYSAALALSPSKASSLYGRGIARQILGDTAADADFAAAKAIQPGIAEQFSKWGITPSADHSKP